jgi:hypothetical protein
LIFGLLICLLIVTIYDYCLAEDISKNPNKLILSAQKGDPVSQFNLANHYLGGTGGLSRSKEKAVDWYKKAANQGHVGAQYQLGSFHTIGYGVQRSNAEATKWFLKAGNQGHLDSQVLLGNYYYEGRYFVGPEYKYTSDDQPNYAESMKWYKKASDQGHVESAFKIACIYKNGLGVAKNDAEATKWFQKAADRGHFYSKRILFDKIEKGPFYSLSGGKLIDAIYRNDKKTIEEIETTSGLKSLNSGSSLLNLVANKYMYAFNQNWPYCHQREKRRRRFSVTIEEKRYQNIYGMDMGSVPSWTSSATYVVPIEFSSLLEKLGSNMGSDHMEMAAKFFRLKKVVKIFDGIDILQQQNKCDSPDIKQFEKNLISLTTQSLKTKR